MNKCIENSSFNFPATEQGLAKFISDKLSEFAERAEAFGGIAPIDISAFSALVAPATKDDIISPNKPEELFAWEEASSFESFEDSMTSATSVDDMKTFILFNNQDKKKYTLKEVLNNIIENYGGFSKEGDATIKKIIDILPKISDNVMVVKAGKAPTVDAIMSYNKRGKTVNVYPEVFKQLTEQRIVKAMLHEAVHAISEAAYSNPKTFEQSQFKALIDDAYSALKVDGDTDYGFTNQSEFIAEIYSNPIFRQKLEDRQSGFWYKFKQAVRRLLGLKADKSVQKIVDSILEVGTTTAEELDADFLFDKNVNVKYSDRSTASALLNHTFEKIEFSIKENIRRTREFADTIDARTIDARHLRKTTQLHKELREHINAFKTTHQAKAIMDYADFVSSSLSHFQELEKQTDPTNIKDVRRLVAIHSTYITGFAVIEDVIQDINDLKFRKDSPISTEQLEETKGTLETARRYLNEAEGDISSYKKEAIKAMLDDIKFFPIIEKKHYDRLSKEHRENKILEDKESWITKQMNDRDKALIDRDVKEHVNKIVTNEDMLDIYSMDKSFSTPVNISSPLIGIMNNYFLEIEAQREETERAKDREFKALFEKLRAEKGTNNPKKLFANLLGKDRNGKYFLQSNLKASFNNFRLDKDKVHEKYNAILAPLYKEKNEVNSPDPYDPKKVAIQRKITRINAQRADALMEVDKKYFVMKEGKKLSVQPEYVVDQNSLSETEKEVRDYFINIIRESKKKTFGKDSLINEYGIIGTQLLELFDLPKITQSNKERIITGRTKGIAGDAWRDMTQLRPDDLEYIRVDRDEAGNVIRRLRVHYRDRKGNFKNEDQSIDLFNIMRLEFKNANTYNLRTKRETDLNFLLDLAKEKKFLTPQKRVNYRNNHRDTVKGAESNTFKMMTDLMESRFYDIMKTSNVKIGSVDANKVVSAINSSAAFMALSLNYASGTANVVNAKAQMFLESFIKGQYIKASSIAKANKIYARELGSTLRAVTDPISDSFVDQVVEMFNVRGEFNLSNADFLRSDMVKKGMSRESLQIFQSSGEHWIQSVITMSVLDGIKAMDSNGNYLNSKGETVKSEKDAASLLDMISKDENGMAVMHPAVGKTTHSRTVDWAEGGRNRVSNLIIKKINDSIGNYRKIDQPNIFRTPLGGLLMLYRKYFVPMGQARLRGWETALKPQDKLTEEDRRFSDALMEYEEGTYVTLARFIRESIKSKQKWLGFKSTWANLSDYQRHNVKRAITEFGLMYVMLPLARQLIHAMAGDDSEYAFFVLYQLRRLDTELSQYSSPAEAFKMIRSPIPSLRILELFDVAASALYPPNWNDVYERGPHKGDMKLRVKFEKQVPVLKEFRRTFEDLYDYQNSSWGTGLGN